MISPPVGEMAGRPEGGALEWDFPEPWAGSGMMKRSLPRKGEGDR